MGSVKGDIMSLIGNEDLKGSFFLLSSQLNAAEYGTNRYPTEKIQDYEYDNTGGPAGQLAVHPGIGQFILDNAENSNRVGQGLNSVKEFLKTLNSEFSTGIHLHNGYLKVPKTCENEEMVKKFIRQNLHLIKTPVMTDVSASGLKPGRYNFSEGTHLVNMVYASAIPIGVYNNPNGEFVEYVAQQIRVAQYYGALKQAALFQKERLKKDERLNIFLMKLGGGVFDNKLDHIIDSMFEAIDLLAMDENLSANLGKLNISVLDYFDNTDTVEYIKRNHPGRLRI